MSVVAHGIDAVDVERFAKLIEKGGRDFLVRCFTDREIGVAAEHRTEERLAGWFAVKEAVLKSLGTGQSNGATFTDIEISHTEIGAPTITLSGKTKEFADSLGIIKWFVSISNIEKLVIASVIGTAA